MTVPDLAVLGLGPAGRALAHRAAAAGLDVVAVDPAPDRTWPATYAAWVDELPDWLTPDAYPTRVFRPRVWARREHVVERDYAVFDNAALQRALHLDGVRVVRARGSLADADDSGVDGIVLHDGRLVRARTVVDARGLPPAPTLAEQTAYGMVVPRYCALPALDGATALFMDWRRDNGAEPGEPASFLYAIPVDADRVLLEETCLVGRPALPLGVLRERLLTRLAARGVPRVDDATVERVRFPVQAPDSDVFAFGSRGGLTHPGTGYGVATSLAATDRVVAALAADEDPGAALWPRRARTVSRLRETGLRALLALPPERTDEFFDAFFTLPAQLQRAYLSDREDPRAVAAAMWTLFRRVPMPVRRTLIRAAR